MIDDIKLYAHHRDVARDAISYCITELANKGINYKQIASTLIEEALEIVSNEKFDITYPSDRLENTNEDYLNDATEVFDGKFIDETKEEYESRIARQDIWRKKNEFLDSVENKKFDKLRRKAWKADEMDDHYQSTKSKMDIFKFSVEHIKAYIKIVGHENISEYDSRYLSDIEKTIKSYVVLQQPEKIETIYEISSHIGQFLPEDIFDPEILQSKKSIFMEHLEIFSSIKSFLELNPNHKQRDIFKALSLDSRKLNYLFVIAEKLKTIKRVRSGDSWLLSLT